MSEWVRTSVGFNVTGQSGSWTRSDNSGASVRHLNPRTGEVRTDAPWEQPAFESAHSPFLDQRVKELANAVATDHSITDPEKRALKLMEDREAAADFARTAFIGVAAHGG